MATTFDKYFKLLLGFGVIFTTGLFYTQKANQNFFIDYLTVFSFFISVSIGAAFLILLIPSLIICTYEETWLVFINNSQANSSFLAISILGLIGTAFALFLFNHIIKNTSALFASSVTYFIPIVAVIIGFFFGERLSVYQILSMFIVLSGVFLANFNSSKNTSH